MHPRYIPVLLFFFLTLSSTALVIKGTYNLYDTIVGGKLIMEDDARVNHFGGKIIYGAASRFTRNKK